MTSLLELTWPLSWQKQIQTWLILVLMVSGGPLLAQTKVIPVIVEAHSRVILSAEADGTLTKLPVETGDEVKKGQLLANVFTGHLGLERKSMRHNYSYKNTEVENLQRLNQRGLSTDEELAKAKMERNIVKAKIDALSLKIARSAIRAPFNGRVVQTLVEQHEWVKAGQPVVEVIDTDRLRVVANLPSMLAVKLVLGDQKKVRVRDLNQVVDVTLTSMTPAVDEQSNTVRTYWEVIGGAGKLLAGMKGELMLNPGPPSPEAPAVLSR